MYVRQVTGVFVSNVYRRANIDTDHGPRAGMREHGRVSTFAATGIEHDLAFDPVFSHRCQPVKELPGVRPVKARKTPPAISEPLPGSYVSVAGHISLYKTR